MSETAAADSVVMERRLPHPPAKVWRALTSAPLIGEWLMPTDFEPVVGHRFTFQAQPQPGWSGVVHCEVLEVEEASRLVYRWGDGSAGDGGLSTVVTWTLAPADGGTQVRMVQSGFTNERNRMGAEYGWTRFLEGLERVAGGLS